MELPTADVEPRIVYYVLGPVLVDGGRGPIVPGGPTTRAVLSSLVINANRAISSDRLLYDVWGDDPPGVHALQSHVSRLRKSLGAGRIIAQEGCYLLRADAGEVDAFAFEQLVDRAAVAEPADARRHCLAAFKLWRGVPFADLADREALHLEVLRLENVRIRAIELCIEADLALGRHREIIGSLRGAVSEFPFHERMWGFLLEALAASGREPEALLAYDELADLLSDELGAEPNKQLQALRAAISMQ